MKNIKNFKYENTYSFERFLKDYGYSMDDVKGYSVGWKEQYHGNILKIYNIYFNDDEYEYFKVVYFKDINEYRQSALGFNGEKLLDWHDDANIVKYKYNNRYIIAKC